ncbi:hypothetical protein CSV86_013220 [Pseudomonas putida CSV86]|uniref:Uncharacterized protein n=2 Tax=Pseudomonas TaxID=286 RepID=A0A177SR02_PSEPU|nr:MULTISPECIES: hypothetical protein [Pseudomonas]MDG9883714.1 hypothetical protein [Pseudomonas sp. GD04058]NNJ16122.1 hypothetical protein [Pseudomonas bharatica CSV86]OAI92740.1 hypothetical protein AYO28_17280 [Pseudomonas putida]
MSEEPQLALTARLLERGRQIERLSDGISLLALGFGLAPLLLAPRHPGLTSTLCALLLILGLAQKYHALRVALDAELIGALANDAGRLGSRTRALDQALYELGLKRGVAERDWLARCRGALRLLRRQGICFAVQVSLALSGLLILPWLPPAA